MVSIDKITQKTQNRFVNLYDLDVTHRNGEAAHYYVASRALGDYVYEFPAGLVERGEDYREAAVREMHEETGLVLTPLDAAPMFEEARFTTVGLTDESCATVYGYADGNISNKFIEDSEQLEIVIADRDEVRRILREEKVAIMCAYQLMHFFVDEEPFAFLGV